MHRFVGSLVGSSLHQLAGWTTQSVFHSRVALDNQFVQFRHKVRTLGGEIHFDVSRGIFVLHGVLNFIVEYQSLVK